MNTFQNLAVIILQNIFLCSACQVNGNIQRITRKRIYERETDHSEEPCESLSNRHGRHRKIPRRSATVAANKLRLMSDVEEELSSSESIALGTKNRKQPHRSASAAARKLLLNDLEEDSSLHSETDKEVDEQHSRRKISETAVAVRKKHVNESESGSSNSESGMQKPVKCRRINGHKQRYVHRSLPKINTGIESSEDDSKSHLSEDGSIHEASYQSLSACKSKAKNNSEADSNPDRCRGLAKQNHKKASTSFRKPKVLSDSEEPMESEKEDERASHSENRSCSETSRESNDSSSNLKSETDSENSNHSDSRKKNNGKGDVFKCLVASLCFYK